MITPLIIGPLVLFGITLSMANAILAPLHAHTRNAIAMPAATIITAAFLAHIQGAI